MVRVAGAISGRQCEGASRDEEACSLKAAPKLLDVFDSLIFNYSTKSIRYILLHFLALVQACPQDCQEEQESDEVKLILETLSCRTVS